MEQGYLERAFKRVRVMVGGAVVADTRRPLLVWEREYYPTYFFPRQDVVAGVLKTGQVTRQGPLGEAAVIDVDAGTGRVEAGAYAYLGVPELSDHVAFVWRKMDHWFEEDEEVYVHARDPYKRVDILRSSRHVRIEIEGVTVAESHQPILLFETGLPVRYYLPRTDVRMDLLVPTTTRTECPYKGTAEYWSVVVDGTRHEDVVWSYPFPTAEAYKIAGSMCFYDELVDVYVDEERLERPITPFSPTK